MLVIDVGSGETDDVRYRDGVFDAERDGDLRYRWLGGGDRTATMAVPDRMLGAASTLELVGEAYESGLAATVTVGGEDLGTVTFDADGFETVRLPLP